MKAALALGGLVTATSASAFCSSVEDCDCDRAPEWAAVIALHPDAGVTVEALERAGGDGGPRESTLRQSGPEGTRYLITSEYYVDNSSYLVDANGKISCGNISVDAIAWTKAVTHRTCEGVLADAGLVRPRCQDAPRPCGCSQSEGTLAGLAFLFLIRRHCTRTKFTAREP